MRFRRLLIGFTLVFIIPRSYQLETGEDIPFDITDFEALSSAASESPKFDRGSPNQFQASEYSTQQNDLSERSSSTCEQQGLSSTFLRIPEVYVMGVPSFVSKIELVTCAKYCRDNIEPVSGEYRPCGGFNFQNNNESPSCEYFDVNAKTGMLNWNVGLRSYYFEKVCLRLNEHCRERAFAFEKRTNRLLEKNAFYSSVVAGQEACLDACLRQSNCYSLNFNRVTKKCELFSISHRSVTSKLKENLQTDYFENNCVHEKDRCPGKRLEFVTMKKTEIRGQDVAIGVRSVRNCMRECVESTHFFCRSFEFDPQTNECFIVEEGSEHSTPSRNLDFYEPVCVDHLIDVPCNRPYVFERIKYRNLIAPSFLADFAEVDLSRCVELCLKNTECKSFAYSSSPQKCRLFSVNRADTMARFVMDVNSDYYELGCEREGVLVATAEPKRSHSTSLLMERKRMMMLSSKETTATVPWTCAPTESQLIEQGRTLRQEYRQVHHIRVRDLKKCETLCAMASIMCQTIAFGAANGDCYLSSVTFDKPRTETFTQPNAKFEVYRLIKRNCAGHQTEPSLNTPAAQFIEYRATISPRESSAIPSRVAARKLWTTITRPPSVASSPASIEFSSIRFRDVQSELPRKSEHELKVAPENIGLTAECLPNGISVEFRVKGLQIYSGVVYAAERFSSCKTTVESTRNFSIFLPRPSDNNSCNVVDFNNTLTSVIVLSNDLIFPLDITTKEDLFYEVLCDYNRPVEFTQTHYGLVVGGLDPKAVTVSNLNSNDRQSTKVLLKIMKDDKPVENVFLGEKLTAIVQSDVDASKLNVIDCNASRIGGVPTDGRNKAVKLISDGCSVMPQVIGDIRRNQNRLEATLAAFRIDGSDQIDIVCSVMVCRDKCPRQEPCSRKRRQVVETRAETIGGGDSELKTVDQRLRVLVQSEPPRAIEGAKRELEQPPYLACDSLLQHIASALGSTTVPSAFFYSASDLS
ncbi:hypothetical protein L596_019032 [Steinernema carpocapsae]|uniref:Apple domain-containing protein n=1 Tax=Steinernema carpocapsae TaxID=34508 RepID=A0A4U5N786_STECR|nr:hypothetical protein L596_019032 [Steinernema carpocapsae]